MILLEKDAVIFPGVKNRKTKPKSQGMIKCMITISLSTAILISVDCNNLKLLGA